MTAIECTAERPYGRDVFRDKWANLAQMYSRTSLWQGRLSGQIDQNGPNVQQMVPITGTFFGTNQVKEQTIFFPVEISSSNKVKRCLISF